MKWSQRPSANLEGTSTRAADLPRMKDTIFANTVTLTDNRLLIVPQVGALLVSFWIRTQIVLAIIYA